jgi:hypothetical protein
MSQLARFAVRSAPKSKAGRSARGIRHYRGTTAERFWPRVVKGGPGECWLWVGHHSRYGYASFWSSERKRHVQACRVAYELVIGPIPKGLTVDHLCRTRGCVNPHHFELVTLKENILRGESPAAKQARQTHCKRGHEFTAENIIRTPTGGRRCRTCTNDYQRRRRNG